VTCGKILKHESEIDVAIGPTQVQLANRITTSGIPTHLIRNGAAILDQVPIVVR